MIIELGNVAAIKREALDDGTTRIVGHHDDGIPRVTTITIPEFDDGSTHPDAIWQGDYHPHTGGKITKLVTPGPRTGGYTHKPGLSVAEFQAARLAALDFGGGVTRLPDHEALLTLAATWPEHSTERPAWVEVSPGDGMPAENYADLERFLHEYFGTDGKRRPADVEATHWTAAGLPGVYPAPPDLVALYTNVGRVLQANAQGGGQVGANGVGTAATATTFTSAATWVTNQWAGYRIVVFNTALGGVWGNVKSNTNAAGASVATVDRWYSFATPGGAAATTPANGFGWAILDGGSTSNWFIGLTGTNITPAAADTSLTAEITTGGAGLIRKIAAFALTSGTSPMSFTEAATWTTNGTDTLPVTIFAMAAFNSMVSSDTTSTMPWETSLNASATLNLVGDQLTVTQTVSGS